MSDLKLLQPTQLGDLTLKNRVVMAALTRGRSGHERVPNEMNKRYYTQRAGAGLIISEGTTVSEQADGWAQSPGIYKDEHVEGWKKVLDSVHDNGGVMVCQLWHTGRASHSSFHSDGSPPVAPSAITITSNAASDGVRDVDDKKHPYQEPRALETDEVPEVVEMFVNGARLAKEAGFDGVEIHGANGYLLDTFFQSSSNTREDRYGGSVENRTRILFEIIEGIQAHFPLNRIGVKLSPNGLYNGMGSEDNTETYTYLFEKLNEVGVGFIDMMDGLGFGFHEKCPPFTFEAARQLYRGFLIANVGYTKETAEERVRDGEGDAVSFGRPFLANPDLVERFRDDLPLAEAPLSGWFSHGSEGYDDWPTYSEQKEKEEAEGKAETEESK